MMIEFVSIMISWNTIHVAAERLDGLRRELRPHRACDPFGGTYQHGAYQGLPGLVKVLQAATTIRDDVWSAIHGGYADPSLDVRMRVQMVFAVDALFRALAASGVVVYDPASEICGVTTTVQVTGLRWHAGARAGMPTREDFLVDTADAAAFAFEGAPAEVLLRGTTPANTGNDY